MDVLSSLPVIQHDSESQTRRRKIHCKQELIVNSLQRFYAAIDDKDEVIQLLEGTSNISLRLIDWFVTNYSKQNNISYILNGQEFLVYTNYKSQLKAYSKKLFDPFCRRERILFQIPGFPMLQTTVGKLNFFRWALEKGVLNYIKLNLPTIEKSMNANAKELQRVRKAISASTSTSTATVATVATATTATTVSTASTRTTRRRIVSSSAAAQTSKLMQKHDFNVEVRFD